MLPRGVISERPWSRFDIRIYKAEGLPTMDSGLMAKVAMVTDRTVFIDPYVRVTFSGQQVCRYTRRIHGTIYGLHIHEEAILRT